MRDLKKVVHTSSPDRGLEHLLKMWPEVKKAVPQATLEVAYGFQLFDRMYANNPSSMAWKAKMLEMMRAPGITDHGRLPQPKLAQLMQRCGVFAYPTHFGEINCISAIKAQAFGCEPVVVNYAALRETVQFGRRVEGDIYDEETQVEFKKQLIAALTQPMSETKRQEMMVWAQKYQWQNIARAWSAEFKEGYGGV